MEYYKEKREQKRDIWRNKNQEFSKIITDTKPRSTNQFGEHEAGKNKNKNKNPPHVIFKIKKAKTEEKWKESKRNKNTLSI